VTELRARGAGPQCALTADMRVGTRPGIRTFRSQTAARTAMLLDCLDNRRARVCHSVDSLSFGLAAWMYCVDVIARHCAVRSCSGWKKYNLDLGFDAHSCSACRVQVLVKIVWDLGACAAMSFSRRVSNCYPTSHPTQASGSGRLGLVHCLISVRHWFGSQ